MVSYFGKLVALAALAFLVVFGAPSPSLNYLKIRNQNSTDVVPNRYIVVYEKDVTAAIISNYISRVGNLFSKRKRGFADGGIRANYAFRDFNGYAVTADNATIAEIAATPEVVHLLLL